VPLAYDDIRFQQLLRENPGAPVEFVAMLYKLDRLIDEGNYKIRELEWEKEQLAIRQKKLQEKIIKELEKK
jgi:hypothetical protein